MEIATKILSKMKGLLLGDNKEDISTDKGMWYEEGKEDISTDKEMWYEEGMALHGSGGEFLGKSTRASDEECSKYIELVKRIPYEHSQTFYWAVYERFRLGMTKELREEYLDMLEQVASQMESEKNQEVDYPW